MDFSQQQFKDLLTLSFSHQEIESLKYKPLEKIIKTIRNKKNKLAILYHPDKNNGDINKTNLFLKITEAYERLIKSESLQSNIFSYLVKKEMQLPLDCISFELEEYFDDFFDKINKVFLELNHSDKHDFVKKYESFLLLYRWLEKNKTLINKKRVSELYRTHEEPAYNKVVLQHLNTLTLQFFGKENLDDISYREAISLNRFKAVIDVEKILNPFKLAIYLIVASFKFISNSLTFVLNLGLRKGFKFIENSSTESIRIAKTIGFAIAFMTLANLFTSFIPLTLVLKFLSLTIITRFLFFVANPINQIIRPIHEKTNIPKSILAASFVLLTVIPLLLTIKFTTLHFAISSLLFAANTLGIAVLFAQLFLAKKVYESNQAIGVFLGITTIPALLRAVTGLVFWHLSPPAYLFCTLPQALEVFAAQLGLLSGVCISINFISYFATKTAALFVSLPLPETPLENEVKKTIQETNPPKNFSKRLFNTSLKNSEQTNLSFFSHNKPSKTKRDDSKNETQGLLTM